MCVHLGIMRFRENKNACKSGKSIDFCCTVFKNSIRVIFLVLYRDFVIAVEVC